LRLPPPSLHLLPSSPLRLLLLPSPSPSPLHLLPMTTVGLHLPMLQSHHRHWSRIQMTCATTCRSLQLLRLPFLLLRLPFLLLRLPFLLLCRCLPFLLLRLLRRCLPLLPRRRRCLPLLPRRRPPARCQRMCPPSLPRSQESRRLTSWLLKQRFIRMCLQRDLLLRMKRMMMMPWFRRSMLQSWKSLHARATH
jgi:hypothetical protein